MSDLDKKITRLEAIKDKLTVVTKEKEELQAEQQMIISSTRKARIKKLKYENEYEIICLGYKCRNIYTSNKDPDAELKDDRPQCRDCGTRVEAKK